MGFGKELLFSPDFVSGADLNLCCDLRQFPKPKRPPAAGRSFRLEMRLCRDKQNFYEGSLLAAQVLYIRQMSQAIEGPAGRVRYGAANNMESIDINNPISILKKQAY
jgi:hypothetical protein